MSKAPVTLIDFKLPEPPHEYRYGVKLEGLSDAKLTELGGPAVRNIVGEGIVDVVSAPGYQESKPEKIEGVTDQPHNPAA